MNQLRRFPGSIPILILLTTAAVFGVLAPWLGFYWDDWPMIFFLHRFGVQGFLDIFTVDRPFLGFIYLLTTPWIGQQPLPWHLFALAMRAACALAFYWAFALLWPRQRRAVGLAALLFVVYPGFRQQPIAVVYGNAWLIFTAYYLSLALMLVALRRERAGRLAWPLTALAMPLSAFNLFPTEYYFGLEFLRPVLLWLALDQPGLPPRQRLLQTARRWAPYLLVVLGFLYWRVFVYQFPGYRPEGLNSLTHEPLKAIPWLLWSVVRDWFYGGLLAWLEPLTWLRHLEAGSKAAAAGIAFGVLAGLVVTAAWRFFTPPAAGRDRWPYTAIALGALALFLAGWPFWIGGLPMGRVFPWDRFALAFMPGSSLLLAGLLTLIGRRRALQAALVALLIGLAAQMHFANANSYRRDWEQQRDLFWQMTARMPQLKPGTLLITHQFPLAYETDNSLNAPLNWTYDPDNRSHQLSVMLNYLTIRLGRQSLPILQPGLPVNQRYRTLAFNSTLDSAVILYTNGPACLRVLDRPEDWLIPELPPSLRPAGRLRPSDQILTDPPTPAAPPAQYFGAEPPDTWCRLFQKAGLARQRGDWQAVARLGDQAFALDDYPNEATERLVFVEGYAHTGQWERARQLTQETLSVSQQNRPAVCALWQRIRVETGAPEADAIAQEAQCPTQP